LPTYFIIIIIIVIIYVKLHFPMDNTSILQI